MSNGTGDQGETSGLKRYGAPGLIFGTTILLFGAAWLLWATGDTSAEGAAITLVGVAGGCPGLRRT
jgi:hypothetical protein